jgi:hypothetical protein
LDAGVALLRFGSFMLRRAPVRAESPLARASPRRSKTHHRAAKLRFAGGSMMLGTLFGAVCGLGGLFQFFVDFIQ